MVQRLIDARLLTASEATVEIAHEALIRAWPQLREWLDEDREGLRLLGHLRASAHEWDRLGRDPGELQRGARLAATIDWVADAHPSLDDLEHSYLDAGRLAEESALSAAKERATRDARSKRRLRTLLAVAAVLLAVALVAGLLALRQRNQAQDARTAADVQRLASQSVSLRSTQRDLAALLAVEAYRRNPSADSRSALFGTFTAAPGFLGYTKVAGADNITGVVLPDGGRAIVAVNGAEVHPVDLKTGKTGEAWPSTLNNPGFSLLKASRDGRLVADLADVRRSSSPEDNQVQLVVYDTHTGKMVMGPIALPFLAGDVAFNPDGTRVAVAGGHDGDLVVYSVPDGREIGRVHGLRPTEYTYIRNTAAVGYSPSGALFVGSPAGSVRELDPATLAVRRTLGLGGGFSNDSLTIVDDPPVLLAGGVNGSDWALTKVDLTTEKAAWKLGQAQLGDVACSAVAVRLGRFYCGSAFGRIEERELDSGAPTGLHLDMQQGAVGSLAIVGGDDARLVAVNFSAPLVATWSLTGGGPITHVVARGHVLTATATSFSPDGRRLLVETANLSSVWDPSTDTELGPSLGGVQAFGWLSNRTIVGLSRSAPTDFVRYDVNGARLDNKMTLVLDVPPTGGAGTADGSRLYVKQGDNAVWTVDVATFKKIEPTFHCDLDSPYVGGVSANADGSLVAISCPNVLVVHDGRSGRELGRIPQYSENSAFVGGDRLVAATQAGKLALFDTKTFKPLTTLAGSQGGAGRLFSSVDGRLLLMEADRTVSLYDLASGRRLGDVLEIARQDVGDATIRPDGLAMAVGGGERGIAIWDLDPAHWATAACGVAGRNLTAEEWKTYLGSLGSYRATCPEYPAG